MKRLLIPALLVCAPFLRAASFTNGQAARAELGQFFFSAGQGLPSNQVLASPGGIAYTNGSLFVADGTVLGANDGTATFTASDGTSTSALITGNRVLQFYTADLPGARTDLSTLSPLNAFCAVCGPAAVNEIGQVDFTSFLPGTAQQGQTATPGNMGAFNLPSAVATDGQVLAVADSQNNRVLIWKTIPTSRNQPADVVLGQKDFTSLQTAGASQTTMTKPQGVWIQNGRLFVADTNNNRVLIWNAIPTANGQAFDLILGQANSYSVQKPAIAAANALNAPTGISSDGVRLFVADTGNNRVLIWNSLPTQNQQAADLVLGQPDMATALPNHNINASYLNASGATIYPSPSANSLNFPRAVLSDGQRLFVADSGNSRVLIFNSIPTANEPSADNVLGQTDMTTNVLTVQDTSILSVSVDNTGSASTMPTPSALAFDGSNLYVADPFNRRVLVFSSGDLLLSQSAVLNAASEITRQEGLVSLVGTVAAGDTVTITIGGTAYTYTEKTGDTLQTVTAGLISAINSSNSNAGDPNVVALAGSLTDAVYLSSKGSNLGFDTISLAASATDTALTVTASGSYLTGGNGATIAPGGIAEINYSPATPASPGLADATVSADSTATIPQSESNALPLTLGGVQVFADGVPLPLFMVSRTQIKMQIPFEFYNRTTASLYVRTVHSDGSVTITSPAALILAPANPGLFKDISSIVNPPPAFQPQHQTGNPSTSITVSLTTVQAGDVATVTVNGRSYAYTVLAADTLATATAGIIAKITGDAQVTATATGATGTILLTSIQSGSVGTGIPITVSVAPVSGKTTAGLALTLNNAATCCSNAGTGAITASNPAVAGEIITLYATGLGVVQDANNNAISLTTGAPYAGPQPNSASNSVSVNIGGSYATVVSAGLAKGGVGVYAVQAQVPSTVVANATTAVYMAQNAFVSNTVTIPVGTSATTISSLIATPNPITVAAGATAGQTTISWNTSVTAKVQVRIGSPAGALFAVGGGTGSQATGAWVTDGMTFYLQDATKATPTSPAATVAILTVHLTTSTATTGGTGTGGTTTTPIAATPIFPSVCPAAAGTVWVANSNITFSAQPGTIQVPLGSSFGETSFSWAVPSATATTTNLYVGGTSAALLNAGVASGTATTGQWVTDGMIFFLQNSTSGSDKTTAKTLACAKVALQHTTAPAGRGTLTASPSTISTTAAAGSTILSWVCSTCSHVQVRVGAPDGALFAAGGSTGSQKTGLWVTNGMVFYLQDASTANPTSASETVATVTVTLQAPASSTGGTSSKAGVITGTPNPILYPAGGAPVGQVTITWSCAACTRTQIRIGSPSGALFSGSASSGSQTTGTWVTDGMVFYLQDASDSNVALASNTVATFTASVQPQAATATPSYSNGGTITASPNPIAVAGEVGQTTISWSCDSCKSVEVHIDSPSGPLFAFGGPTGAQTTGLWVTNGTRFFLQYRDAGVVTSVANTLAWIEIETVPQ